MTRKELIGFCRYYKGEEECPKWVNESFWSYEQSWVVMSINHSHFIGNMIDDYIAYGLANFEIKDNVPLSLKAVLFNRFSHWRGCDAEGFKRWYKKEYLKNKEDI